jgi:hypothetical protein
VNTFNIKVDSKLHRNPDFLEISSGVDFPYSDAISRVGNEMTKKIIQFEDEAIKNALKELGWLSPDEYAELLEKHEDELEGSYNLGYDHGCCAAEADGSWK